MNDRTISVLQVIDSLALGGAERMAVNLSNMLPRTLFRLHLCTTRADGPLSSQILPDVERIRLNRRTRFDEPRAILELVRYIRRNNIRIIHCHENTVFLCSIVALFCPNVALIWHDHFGPMSRPLWLYKLGTARVTEIVSVNEDLADWARNKLGFAGAKVHFVNNFVVPRHRHSQQPIQAKPECKTRIVCTANINATKDILGLVRAMAMVVAREPKCEALVIGAAKNPESEKYLDSVRAKIIELGLEKHLLLLGSRDDVDQILATCEIGVICSIAEGLPLALIEYGMAGLATVATNVGQCSAVLGHGDHGLVVPPSDPEALADAILRLLRSVAERKDLGTKFKDHCEATYGPERNIEKLVGIYDSLLK